MLIRRVIEFIKIKEGLDHGGRDGECNMLQIDIKNDHTTIKEIECKRESFESQQLLPQLIPRSHILN